LARGSARGPTHPPRQAARDVTPRFESIAATFRLPAVRRKFPVYPALPSHCARSHSAERSMLKAVLLLAGLVIAAGVVAPDLLTRLAQSNPPAASVLTEEQASAGSADHGG